jgi:hypothetical protein
MRSLACEGNAFSHRYPIGRRVASLSGSHFAGKQKLRVVHDALQLRQDITCFLVGPPHANSLVGAVRMAVKGAKPVVEGLGWHMDWADYLRDEAAKYRQLAEAAEDLSIKQEFLELAAVCEEAANNIEDRMPGG